MVEICKKNEFINKVIGLQSYDKNKDFSLSSYICLLPYRGAYLIYNTFTKQMCELTEDEYTQIVDKEITEDFKKVLVENWYMFNQDNPCHLVTNQVRSFLKLVGTKGKRARYTIFTTTGCNARCFYCYQAGTPVHTMDESTALAVVDYIEKRRDERPLYLRWFGGEPLCNIKAIDTICNKLQENGTEFKSTIVTNGYLFNESNVIKAKQLWNLTDAQITLDGLEETYNKSKNYVYKDGPSPFNVVLNNIQSLLTNEIYVDIRMNMDKHNFDELKALIDLLVERFGKNKYLNLYCRPLFENAGIVKTSRTDSERRTLTERFIEIENYIKKVANRPTKALPKTIKVYSCMADNPDTCFISPQGYIGNCEHYPDSDFTGSIFNGDIGVPWDKYYPDVPECNTCPAYPDCYRLVGCNEHPECYEYERYIMLNKYYDGMKQEYDVFLENKECS